MNEPTRAKLSYAHQLATERGYNGVAGALSAMLERPVTRYDRQDVSNLIDWLRQQPREALPRFEPR